MKTVSFARLIFPLTTFLFSPLVLAAQELDESPRSQRAMLVPHTAVRPLIDGNIEESLWQNAGVAADFWISAEQRPPTSNTRVLVLRGDTALYFAFYCYDDQPEAIHAIKTRRDSGLGNDDSITIELDSFRNFRTISRYSVNPLGTQNDALSGGRARKIEWKGDWKAAAKRTDFGWSAEVEIPYSILNYHVDARSFGVNFVRYQNRSNEYSRWADVTPQYRVEFMGQLGGLELPQQAKSQPWTALPYVIAGTKLTDIKGKLQDQLVYGGATIRYEPRPNLTSVLSIYPDFSQLESQVTNIDFSYTEKFRRDTRPFFQEGSAFFGNDNGYFYSNRISDFYAGFKTFAQVDEHAIAGMLTTAPNQRLDGVFRYSWQKDARHSANLMLVTSNRSDIDNRLLVAQFGGREESGLFYSVDLASSSTRKSNIGDGQFYYANIGWRNDHWWVGVSTDSVDKDYFPANGLFNTDLYNTRDVSAFAGYYRQLRLGNIREVSANISLFNRETESGLTQNEGIWVGAGIELEQQVRLYFGYYDADYRPVGSSRGSFSSVINNDAYWLGSIDFNTRSSQFGYGVYFSDGDQGGAQYRYLAPYIWVKPTVNTSLKLSSEQLENFGTFDQTNIQAGWDITPQDSLVMRYIFAEAGDYERLAYRRSVRSGMDIFAVYNHDPNEDRQFSIKLLWSVQ